MNGAVFGHWETAAIAVAVLAFLLRLLFLSSLADTPFWLEHFSDSRLYMQLAADIAAGGIDTVYFMSPLYPYVVAGVAGLTGNPELWVRILQALAGAMTAWLVFRIGAQTFSRGAGLAAAAVVAAYAPLIYYDGLLLTESLLTLLLTAHLLALLQAFRKGRIWDWVFAGVLLGLAVVTRATTVLFLPALVVVWLFLRGEHRPAPSRIAAYAAAALLTLLPTALHNASTGGVFMPVTSSFGFNLYAGNNATATGLYSMPERVDLANDPNGHHWVEKQTGKDLNAAEISAYWRDRALYWMGKHPGEAAGLLLRKLLLFFHPGEIDQLGLSLRFYTTQFGAIIGIPAVSFSLILVLAAAGIGLAMREHRGDWPLQLFLLVFVLSTVVFFVSGRLRLPIMPLLILYAAHAVVTMTAVIRAGQPVVRHMAAFAGMAVAVVVLLVQPDVRQGFEQEHLKLGQSAFNRASYDEAEQWFRRSLEEQETVDGLVNLGNALAAQQRPEEAAALYRQAIRSDSTYALAWFNFGNLRMQTGSPQYAYGYWKKAVEHDPRLAGARRNLGLLLMQAGRYDEAEQQFEAYLRLESQTREREAIQQDLERLRAMRRSADPAP
ncbi:MAG: glycosyltransferase family 39 protein [Bacteroidetes bacterium]|nr:glycosyltransferase family 39 protein [Bacteroidota bacterium]